MTGNEKIDEQWRSTRAQNCTAEVSFFTIIIRLRLCTTAITTV